MYNPIQRGLGPRVEGFGEAIGHYAETEAGIVAANAAGAQELLRAPADAIVSTVHEIEKLVASLGKTHT